MRDLRDKLPRAQWSIGHRSGNPTGATLHYNGPPVGAAGNIAAEVAQLASDARYHMRPDLIGGDGIQYHYAVLSNGERCQLRDESAILWHSANAVGNNTHLAIHLPLGGAQAPTAAQWKGATDLFDELISRYGWSGRSAILGHREWPRSDGKPQKSCPGPIVFRSLQLWRGQLPMGNSLEMAHSYRCAVDVALIREGPGQQYKVALGGFARLHKGDSLGVDAIVTGTPPKGSQDARWAHAANSVGFVHMSVLEPAP